jgi:hypothetical protein
MLRLAELVKPTVAFPFFHSSFLSSVLPAPVKDEPSDE